MKKLYAFIGRSIFLVLRPLIKIYFKRYSTKRVRIIVKSDSGKLLLIKGWLSNQKWELPGGGIKTNEQPVIAAVRELKEETGLAVNVDDLKCLGEFKHADSVIPYVVVLYAVNVGSISAKRSKLRQFEIIDQQEFLASSLPIDVSPLVPLALRRLSEFE